MADFKYQSFLPLIDVLLNGASPAEEYVRTAANRAYYSAYGTFRQRLLNTFKADCFDKQGCHGELVKACRHPSNTAALKTIGVELSALLDLREWADYRWADTEQISRVRQAKTRAGKVVEKINFLREADLEVVYKAIQSRPRQPRNG